MWLSLVNILGIVVDGWGGVSDGGDVDTLLLMLLLLVMLVTGPLLMVAGNHSVVDDGSGLICLSDDPSFNPTYVHFFIPNCSQECVTLL